MATDSIDEDSVLQHSEVLKQMIEDLVEQDDWNPDYLKRLAIDYEKTRDAEAHIGYVCACYDLPVQATRLGLVLSRYELHDPGEMGHGFEEFDPATLTRME